MTLYKQPKNNYGELDRLLGLSFRGSEMQLNDKNVRS